MNYKLAVLMTCHNRRDKTMTCLSSLFKATLRTDYSIDVFLVDDGSTDRTGEAVKEKYPEINIIKGDGSLFWNQGMRLAWNVARSRYSYDFYLWLNDDVILFEHALHELIDAEREIEQKRGEKAIIVGAFQNTFEDSQFAYGGREELGRPIIPNGTLQECMIINGNAVLISNIVYDRLGNLSDDFTHALGDFDYSLRANREGIVCCTTPSYIGVCPRNEGVPAWCSPETSLAKRIELLYSPRGININEYYKFVLSHKGRTRALVSKFKVYFRVLFPKLYLKLKK